MPLFLTCSQCLCAQSKLMDLEEVFRLAGAARGGGSFFLADGA